MAETDVIIWSQSRLLAWSDFKADPNPAVFEDAHSAIRYRPTWTINSGQDEDGRAFFSIVNLHMIVEFHPRLSWARPARDDRLLHHEQGHFDLAELFIRNNIGKIRDILYGRRFPVRGGNVDQCKQFAKEDSGLVVNSETDVLENRLDTVRAEYDTETEYGMHAAGQADYDKIFAALRA